MESKNSNIDLDNLEFQQAYSLLKQTNTNVFLTGKAGTGKSTFLRYICTHLKKKYVILAPTGVAAVNVGGVTIHSFFQMPLRPVPPDDPDYSISIFKNPKKFSRQKRKLIKELELIIIDEVSMVRPDMIDFIDRVLRGVTGKRGKPFGGVQLLLVGDIFQLEPVVNADTRMILSKYYRNFFFFNAQVYKSAQLVSIELKKIYRQSDPDFIGILDRIRMNHTTKDDIRRLNSPKEDNNPHEKFGITLTTRRDIAAVINKEKMDAIQEKEFIFTGEIIDYFPEKLLPTDLNLILKKDSQVMLIRNDKERRWVNGSLAIITDIDSSSISIKLENGKEEKLERETWNNINYIFDEKEKKVKEEIIGQFIQFPVRAAWALTIHKSQGLTFSSVAIDMGPGAFSAGQTYVALSRCRTLEGITFLNPITHRDVIVSSGAKLFSEEYNDSRKIETALKESQARRLSKDASVYFDTEDYDEAVECLWQVHETIGGLERKSVRRMIASKLKLISKFRRENEKLRNKLKKLSEEYSDIGAMIIETGKDIASAEHNFKRALDLDSENDFAKIGLAQCLLSDGKNKEALIMLKGMVKKEKGIACKALMIQGLIYEIEKDYSSALLAFISCHKKDKGDKRPIEKIIEMYEKLGMDKEARQYKDWLQENYS